MQNYNITLPLSDDEAAAERQAPPILDMADSVRAVEELLQYKFKNPKLLEEALTHSSYADSASYQRLEFLGDVVLGMVISNHVYLANRGAGPGVLSLLRAANISTEKLARVAVRHGLYKYVRHNAEALNEKVWEFVMAVQEEVEMEALYGGAVKAPKVLADITESIAGAVYEDCGFDLKALWVIFRGLMEPIITLDILESQPQPVTMLFQLCQKQGKELHIRHWRIDDKSIASVYVDGKLVDSAASEQKDNAKLHAAKAALEKLSGRTSLNRKIDDMLSGFDETDEIPEAKKKLHEICGMKKWPKPVYRIEKVVGPAHEKRFICSVRIEHDEYILFDQGTGKSRVKDAENSAASTMLHGLRNSGLPDDKFV